MQSLGWTGGQSHVFNGLEFSFSGGDLAGDARIVPAGGIRRTGEGLEQRLHNMMRLITVEQFQVKIAAGFVGKALKKLTGQAKTEGRGHILFLFPVLTVR